MITINMLTRNQFLLFAPTMQFLASLVISQAKKKHFKRKVILYHSNISSNISYVYLSFFSMDAIYL